MKYKIDPTHEFEYELSFLDDSYFYIAAMALSKAPDYFWFAPASSSGKYHPKSSLGIGGLVRHVKSVFYVAKEMSDHPSYGFTDEEKMQIRVAAMLHDCCKQGTEPSGTNTVHDHPMLIRVHLKPPSLKEEQEIAWCAICDIIETHMGPWNKDKHEVSDVILPLPTTEAQKLLHMADYLASRASVEIDTTQRTEQLGYKKPPEPAWKKEPATEGMINLIAKLYKQASDKGIKDLPNVQVTDDKGNMLLTKGSAGDIIDDLKARLGQK